MKIKHEDIIIDKDEPFKNCKLGREQYATVLTGIVNAYKDGFVMGLNNEWGGGKTTFVKMWQKHLEKDGFKTIYFNAWENDFDTNPLVAIMAELEGLTKANKDKLNDLFKIGGTLIKNTPEALIKGVAGRFINVETYENAIDSGDIFKKEIEEYNNKKKAIGEFKIKLEEYIKSATPDKPLIFIIDELDRCRPTYAVEVLENVKHLFSIKGITFVLSIDKVHLSSSIRGYYGSEHINTDEYLRRFIDLEYSLPEPDPKRFIEYLYEYYGFDEILNNHISKNHETFLLKEITEYLFTKSNSTLRQQEKVFGLTSLVLRSFQKNRELHANLIFILVYFKMFYPIFYSKIENQVLTPQELHDNYISIMGESNHDIELDIIDSDIRVLLIWTYHYGLDRNRQKLYPIEEVTDGNKAKLLINYPNDKNRLHTLEESYESWQEYLTTDTKITIFINKINLTKPFLSLQDDKQFI